MSEKKPQPRPAKPDAKSDVEDAADSPESGPVNPMDVGLLKQLVKLMAANDLSSVDLRDGERRINLQRGGPPPIYAPAPVAPAVAAPAAPPPMAAMPAAAAPPVDDTAGLVAVKSPMVGTFYAAPSPDAKNFVAVGDKVGPDTDICVIEAMKVFNNIKAETSGTVAKILVDNGQPVEFGQSLFLVKP